MSELQLQRAVYTERTEKLICNIAQWKVTLNKSRIAFVHPAFAGLEESYLNPAIDEKEVRMLKSILLKTD